MSKGGVSGEVAKAVVRRNTEEACLSRRTPIADVLDRIPSLPPTQLLDGRPSSPPHATPALSFREGTQSECSCYEADELRHAPSRLRSFAPPRSRRIQMAPTTLLNAGRQNPRRKAKLQGCRPSFHPRTPAIRTERSPAHRACSI